MPLVEDDHVIWVTIDPLASGAPRRMLGRSSDLKGIRFVAIEWSVPKVRDAIKLIETDGWYEVTTKGSHRQYKHGRNLAVSPLRESHRTTSRPARTTAF